VGAGLVFLLLWCCCCAYRKREGGGGGRRVGVGVRGSEQTAEHWSGHVTTDGSAHERLGPCGRCAGPAARHGHPHRPCPDAVRRCRIAVPPGSDEQQTTDREGERERDSVRDRGETL
jgi:hypothetical protein